MEICLAFVRFSQKHKNGFYSTQDHKFHIFLIFHRATTTFWLWNSCCCYFYCEGDDMLNLLCMMVYKEGDDTQTWVVIHSHESNKFRFQCMKNIFIGFTMRVKGWEIKIYFYLFYKFLRIEKWKKLKNFLNLLYNPIMTFLQINEKFHRY
jgi:hypothetical protein